MTQDPSRRPDPRDDAEIEHERSSVRSRVTPAPRRSIDELLRTAKVLLADIPADHPRASLLRVAVWRRDAALLSALVDEISLPRRDARATLLPPPRSR